MITSKEKHLPKVVFDIFFKPKEFSFHNHNKISEQFAFREKYMADSVTISQ